MSTTNTLGVTLLGLMQSSMPTRVEACQLGSISKHALNLIRKVQLGQHSHCLGDHLKVSCASGPCGAEKCMAARMPKI